VACFGVFTMCYDCGMPSPSHLLMQDTLRLPVERVVSAYYGRAWSAASFTDLVDFSSHPCAILSDGSLRIFVKFSGAANGLDQFEVELAGLRYLQERAGVLIPTPIGNIEVEGGVLMVMEAAQEVERGPRQWREIGETLARIHTVSGERFGLDRQGYFGPLYQDNRPLDDWLAFYSERRIWPRLMGAIDSGNLPTQVIWQVEKLITRLPGLDIPPVKPCLLHGDAQKNNYISTARGAMVIDPAVYYGNPEIDLAYVDYFEPVPEDVFLGYQEILPIAPGFAERRDLWRIAAYLAAVEVEGAVHLNRLTPALQKYL